VAVTVLNTLMGRVLDVLLSPFRLLPPLVGLSVVSLVTAVVVVLAFRATSNQQGLADVKRRMAAALFEIRLFNDDLGAVFRAQGELLRHNATYLRLSLVPMLWMIVPIAFVVAQLDARYGYAGLKLGEPVLLKVALRDGVTPTSGGDATLEAPPQVSVLTPAVWFPSSNEIVWRIRPEASGAYELTARIDGESLTKSVDATEQVVRRSPVRVAPGWIAQFMNPSERPLPNGAAATAISVPYARRTIRILGWDADWLIVFFVVSTVFAWLLRKPLRVTV
jgi:uncharacterized membrane protein (DUF106 family)